jgi:prepilin-type processing-associated H-X9-DG protein
LQNKYVTDWRVFRSPFDKVTSQRPDKRVAPGVPVSYGVNVNAYNIHTSKYRSPSELVLMAPNPTPQNPMRFDGTSNVNVTLPMPAGASSKGGTHSNRNQINVLFADAHVSSMIWRDFAQTTGDDGLRRWYPEGKPPEEEK